MTPGTPKRKPTLRHLLTETDRFLIAAELVTSRGLITDERARQAKELGRTLAADPRVDLLSITDNPAGSSMLAPDALGRDIFDRGQEVSIHLACKDWNRNGLQTRAWDLSSEGFHNILALSGDAPIVGYRGAAAPVFDIDSVGLLAMLAEMNDGLPGDHPGQPSFSPTNFFLGCAVTNHKGQEREVMPQYFKLRKKIENGARFVINQIGFNARKDDELLRWMEHDGLDTPVLANVYVLGRSAARAFCRQRVPGAVVSDALLEQVERYAAGADNGRAFFVELAAKQVAIARGLGFRGAYLGGHVPARDFQEILDRADSFAAEDWRAFAREVQYDIPGEWYFFERDPDTGLSSSEVNGEYLASKRRRRGRGVPLSYRFSRAMHRTVFEPGAPLHAPAKRFFGAVDRAPKPVGKALHMAEQAAKVPLFACRDCGDCSLPEIAYLCPESQCAKNQRNGPCGGTREGGKCEVGELDCIWALAYDRLKAYGEEEQMLDGPAVIKNNALAHTSAWANTLLERDHHAQKDDPRGADAG